MFKSFFVKQGGFFNRWFRKLINLFKKRPKEISPTRSKKLYIKNYMKKTIKCHHADEGSRKRNYEQAKKKAKILKKKFNMTESQGNILDKLIADANTGKGADMPLVNNLLDPKKLTKKRVQKLMKQYEEGKRKKRGPSCMMTRSNLSLVASKRKVQNLMEDGKTVSKNLLKILKKYKECKRAYRSTVY